MRCRLRYPSEATSPLCTHAPSSLLRTGSLQPYCNPLLPLLAGYELARASICSRRPRSGGSLHPLRHPIDPLFSEKEKRSPAFSPLQEAASGGRPRPVYRGQPHLVPLGSRASLFWCCCVARFLPPTRRILSSLL